MSLLQSQCHSITLAVKRFPSPHTAARVLEVFESVIEDWKLPVFKIFPVLTDNGSNMLAAFTGDNEREDDTMNISDIEEDKISDDDDKLNDAAVMAIDAGEEVIELDLEDYEDISASSQKAIEEFERSELDHHSTFHNYKCVSCFIRTLQLVVKVFEVNPSFSATLKKAHCIVRKVNKSTKATEKLIAKVVWLARPLPLQGRVWYNVHPTLVLQAQQETPTR